MEGGGEGGKEKVGEKVTPMLTALGDNGAASSGSNCSKVKWKGKYTDLAVRIVHCHAATGTHMPHGITTGRGDIPALTPAEAGTRFIDPGGMQG